MEGRKVVAAMAGAAFLVTGLFIALTLENLDKVRTSAAVRRSEAPILKMPTGDMVIVPEGEFQTPPGEAGPALGGFYIDRLPVPVDVYAAYAREAGKPPGSAFGEDRRGFCEWAGKRLPTRGELAKAGRGATTEKDTSIYGALGLAGAGGFRCAMDVPVRPARSKE